MSNASCVVRRPQTANRKPQYGFTLIELMISIGILTFGLILVLQGFAYSLNVLRISESNLRMSLLSEEKMAQLQINAKQGIDTFFKELKAESKIDDIEFKWQTQVVADEEFIDLNQVQSTVSWKEGKRKGAIPLITYLRILPKVDS